MLANVTPPYSHNKVTEKPNSQVFLKCFLVFQVHYVKCYQYLSTSQSYEHSFAYKICLTMFFLLAYKPNLTTQVLHTTLTYQKFSCCSHCHQLCAFSVGGKYLFYTKNKLVAIIQKIRYCSKLVITGNKIRPYTIHSTCH